VITDLEELLRKRRVEQERLQVGLKPGGGYTYLVCCVGVASAESRQQHGCVCGDVGREVIRLTHSQGAGAGAIPTPYAVHTWGASRGL
jgi:hypothetical protein